MKSKAAVIASLGGLFAVILLAGYFLLFSPPNFRGDEFRFGVTRGKSLDQIATDLASSGVVRSKFGLRIAWAISGVKTVRAGTYQLSPRMDAWDIARTLGAGQTQDFSITIPEGYTVAQIAETLQKNGIVDEAAFIASAATHPRPISQLSTALTDVGLEGYLFPDTYDFYPETKPSVVINEMLANFSARTASLSGQIQASGRSLHEIIILASLVEKEANNDTDRRQVAGVILNRLEKNMRLDVDATTRYAVDNWDKPLTQAELDSDSPYNTRKHAGLPPGPICNPGLAAIKAVLDPIKSDYLYYLTGTDGKTYYAKTNDEHNQNKAKYIK